MKSKMVLILALVMGIITTILFFQYMKQMNTEKTATVHTMDVVVAKEKIAKNEKINVNKLEMVKMPENSSFPQAIKRLEEADGKLANATIEKGEPLLAHRLGTELEEGVYLSRKVRDGFRAITVGVNFNQSVSNLIEPEDEVDVVFTKILNVDAGQVAAESTLLLQEVRVLAVGRKMLTPENTKEPYAEYNSVSLEVIPEEAIKLVNAAAEGQIHLILNKRPTMNEENKMSKGQ